MTYITRELKELWLALFTILSFYYAPSKFIGALSAENSIEFAVRSFKKSIGLLIIIFVLMSSLFPTLSFLNNRSTSGEVYILFTLHGAITALLIAALCTLLLRDRENVSRYVGLFICCYWIPLWLWTTVMRVVIAFKTSGESSLGTAIIEGAEMLGVALLFLTIIWVHSTAIYVYGIMKVMHFNIYLAIPLGVAPGTLSLLTLSMMNHLEGDVRLLTLVFGLS